MGGERGTSCQIDESWLAERNEAGAGGAFCRPRIGGPESGGQLLPRPNRVTKDDRTSAEPSITRWVAIRPKLSRALKPNGRISDSNAFSFLAKSTVDAAMPTYHQGKFYFRCARFRDFHTRQPKSCLPNVFSIASRTKNVPFKHIDCARKVRSIDSCRDTRQQLLDRFPASFAAIFYRRKR